MAREPGDVVVRLDEGDQPDTTRARLVFSDHLDPDDLLISATEIINHVIADATLDELETAGLQGISDALTQWRTTTTVQ
ncbi:MAG: hypothetical protein ACTSX8_10620 [Alphaproteobacteria bacterium]